MLWKSSSFSKQSQAAREHREMCKVQDGCRMEGGTRWVFPNSAHRPFETKHSSGQLHVCLSLSACFKHPYQEDPFLPIQIAGSTTLEEGPSQNPKDRAALESIKGAGSVGQRMLASTVKSPLPIDGVGAVGCPVATKECDFP